MTNQTETRSTKPAGAAGMLGVTLGVVGGMVLAPIIDFPGTTAGAAEITSFVSGDRGALLGGMLFNTFAVTLWMVFGAGIWLRLRQATGGESFESACFAFGLVGFTTLLLAGFVPFMLLAYRDGAVGDPQLLYDASFGLLAMSGAPTAVALGAYAVLVFRTAVLPTWTAVLAAIGAGAHVVLLASFVARDGFFSLEGQVITAIPGTLFVWIFATGGALYRQSGRASAV